MLVGIAGGIGSGKSTICRALEALGYNVYYTDVEAKRIIVSDKDVKQRIAALLGNEVYDADGNYQTQVVAERVFQHPELLQGLNHIVWPAVEADLRRWAERHEVCFVESALLWQSGLDKLCGYTIYVDAPINIRVARTCARDHAKPEQVERRIRTQKDEAGLANLVLMNDGSVPVSQLAEQITSSLP